ncbi:MAG TPA: hypothetical protein VGD67_11370 [Pseudonocardiaceae bacterium]
MNDLAVNLLASAIAGVTVWLGQKAVRVRRLARLRAFLGAAAGARCTVAVARHAASPSPVSVHRRDLAAVVEVATLLRQCGASADVLVSDTDLRGVGDTTEFCIGGPIMNSRSAAHLARFAPALTIAPISEDPDGMTMRLAGKEFRRVPGAEEYVLVLRIATAVGARLPLWVICGQTARSNHAAAHWLSTGSRALVRRHGTTGSFAVALKVVNPRAYDHHFVEVAAEFTAEDLAAPPAVAA